MDIENKKAEENQTDSEDRRDSFSPSPLQDVPLLLPQEADAIFTNGIDQKITDESKITGNFSFSFGKEKVEALVPDASRKNSVDELDFLDLQSNSQMSDSWSETSCEDGHDVSSGECGQVGPRTACRCQVR